MNTAPAATITADKFARVVDALSVQFVGLADGAEWPFIIAEGIEIRAWAPRLAHLVLEIAEFDGPVIRTVTVCPGVDREWEVIAGDNLMIAETHGTPAAFSAALDYLTEPFRAATQSQPDAFAV